MLMLEHLRDQLDAINEHLAELERRLGLIRHIANDGEMTAHEALDAIACIAGAEEGV
jgi:hypothetical protein